MNEVGDSAGRPDPQLGAALRATTYVPPIVIGIVTYLLWKRGLAKDTYTNDPDVRPPAIPAGG
jgi:hypothetical protein